jgi:hypothetical protein
LGGAVALLSLETFSLFPRLLSLPKLLGEFYFPVSHFNSLFLYKWHRPWTASQLEVSLVIHHLMIIHTERHNILVLCPTQKLYNCVQLIRILYDAFYNFGLSLKADISTTNEWYPWGGQGLGPISIVWRAYNEMYAKNVNYKIFEWPYI